MTPEAAAAVQIERQRCAAIVKDTLEGWALLLVYDTSTDSRKRGYPIEQIVESLSLALRMIEEPNPDESIPE